MNALVADGFLNFAYVDAGFEAGDGIAVPEGHAVDGFDESGGAGGTADGAFYCSLGDHSAFFCAGEDKVIGFAQGFAANKDREN